MVATHPRDLAVWTIGHSTRTWSEFIEVLGAHQIEAIVDVRRFPGSKRYPWFASEAMASELPRIDMLYQWVPQLGGRRQARAASPNGAWRNAAFQGYADHMASTEFSDGYRIALEMARQRRTALMCAEAVWWQCHRRLIADLLHHRGVEVLHIVDRERSQAHPLNPDACAVGDYLIYPPAQTSLFSSS